MKRRDRIFLHATACAFNESGLALVAKSILDRTDYRCSHWRKKEMDYKVGTADPAIRSDEGSEVWKSMSPTLTARAEKFAVEHVIVHAASLIGPNAAYHLKYYFGNTRKALTI